MGLLVWHFTNTQTYESLMSPFCMYLTLVLYMEMRIFEDLEYFELKLLRYNFCFYVTMKEWRKPQIAPKQHKT